ncbi:MAG: LapA family protein [Alphaproteobacteria bacterium]|nr:LapA family protein [Alphaproteobacteria bacterium]
MLKRIITVLVAFPVAILLVTLAVINRHEVRMVLDPFKPKAPSVAVDLPFYFYLFGAMLLGVLIGGVAVWMGQGRWRKTARVRAQEVRRWQAEANRLTKERDAQVMASSSNNNLALTHR